MEDIMKSMKLFFAVCVAAFVASSGAVLCLAEDDGDHWHHYEHGTYDLVLGRAKTSLQETVLIKGSIKDTQVIAARLDDMDKLFSFSEEPVVFQLIWIKNGEAYMEYIDPFTGKQLSSKKLNMLQRAYYEVQKPGKDGVKLSLADAMDIAEKVRGGKAISAELEKEDNLLFYKVWVSEQGSIQQYLIDSVTGKSFRQSGRRDHDHEG